MNNPFDYTPDPLCLKIKQTLFDYLDSKTEWQEELKNGKMFGVMVVEDESGNRFSICAFSGTLAGYNYHPFFVPPVFDMLNKDGYFRKQEAVISNINSDILLLECNAEYVQLHKEYNNFLKQSNLIIEKEREIYKQSKIKRDLQRRSKECSDDINHKLERESQYQKAQIKRALAKHKIESEIFENKIKDFTSKIELLKEKRATLSAELQTWIFSNFLFLNANGKERSLLDIFSKTVFKLPPAGAGECAAPKLFQYAYKNRLKPISMAEFWYGKSPKTEMRIHGHFYPSCKGKCEPILNHMLEGLDISLNPNCYESNNINYNTQLQIVWEDRYLMVISKPIGMLSVPGKSDKSSVYSVIKERYNIETPLLVHRLDMDTSGLLVIAKSIEIYKNLQKQFINREVKKRYRAILDGIIDKKSGQISLNMCADIYDRPKQMVVMQGGKEAITNYKVVEEIELNIGENHKRCTVVDFYPITGRTHQLRVHSAHHMGLNCPILGDPLYGIRADRMYLHAIEIIFNHPVTQNKIELVLAPQF